MKTLRQWLFFLSLICSFVPGQAFGWAAEYGPGESISAPENWPAPLLAIARLPARFTGYFVNADDYLAFRGDAAA